VQTEEKHRSKRTAHNRQRARQAKAQMLFRTDWPAIFYPFYWDGYATAVKNGAIND